MPIRMWQIDIIVVAMTGAVLLWMNRSERSSPPPAPSAAQVQIQQERTADVEWDRLPIATRRLLAPLKPMWAGMADDQRTRWRQIAARVCEKPLKERRRVQDRLAGWARLTPRQRADARVRFVQTAPRLDARQRREQWQRYEALLPDQRPQALSASMPQAVSPALVRAAPGASTVLVTQLSVRRSIHEGPSMDTSGMEPLAP